MGAAVNKDDGNEGMLTAARAYTRRGWRVVPVRPGEKSVAIVRWPEMRLEEGDLPKWFRGAADNNIGILTGEPSGGLVDIDCDALEARAAAKELLPATGMISGRASAPASHYWYRIDGEVPATAKFADVGAAAHRGMLIELRSTGCQTIAPPSIHPSGEVVRWEREGEPGVVSG